MGAITAILVAFISIFVPGFLLALALLKKTELHLFEISVIGFIFGLLGPAGMTWIESYFMNSIHAFTFSLGLFEGNAILLTIIGLILCIQQGVFKNFFPKDKPTHTVGAHGRKFDNKKMTIVWVILLALMLVSFMTRIANISIAPKFFEFDPYFDMIDAKSILTLGYQFLLDPSAWPVVSAGTNHRIQPIVPYLEAYWYDLANSFGFHHAGFSTSLMSYVSSFYPPITAALLTFVIFMLLYHEYDPYIALIGAGLAAAMPALITIFISGEQLLEAWGIFSLFFFFAAYMMAIKQPKSKRLAILAGIAFASTFLGAHYFTVDTGILAVYIALQGAIDVFRGNISKDFYKMNVIVLAVISIFLILYDPYGATIGNGLPSLLGIPITILLPAAALLFVFVLDQVPKLAKKYNVTFKSTDFSKTSWQTKKAYLLWLGLIILISIGAFFTPLGAPVRSYLNLSYKFTNPSSALFMTVQEFEPTGLFYNFGSAGFGLLGAHLIELPLIISAIALVLLILSVFFRDSRTGVLYIAISLPLMYAGFKEAKYLPHLGAVIIMLFAIMLGELILLADHGFKLRFPQPGLEGYQSTTNPKYEAAKSIIYAVGIFSLSTVLGMVYLIYMIFNKPKANVQSTKVYPHRSYVIGVLVIFVIIFVSTFIFLGPVLGESISLVQITSAAITYNNATATASCNKMANQGNSVGYQMFCSTVPEYWLEASAWMAENIGPTGPRVLAWWDYGDWINWYGNTNAVIRGDNSVPKEDYATAASFVLSSQDHYALATIMNSNQTKYVLFDEALVSKWGALDYLACIDINATSTQYAIEQGATQSPPAPYALGTSQCELSHDPAFVLLPYAALTASSSQEQQSSLESLICPISTPSTIYYRGYVVTGQTLSNQTVCVPLPATSNLTSQVLTSNGVAINAYINFTFYQGEINLGGSPYVQFLEIYTPNGANNTITDAPSEFYSSNFYKGYFLGNLPGFTEVYPSNAVGVNYLGGYYPIRIFALNNFTGSLPPVPQKPSWVTNNYTIP
jgi:hypothetical protein